MIIYYLLFSIHTSDFSSPLYYLYTFLALSVLFLSLSVYFLPLCIVFLYCTNFNSKSNQILFLVFYFFFFSTRILTSSEFKDNIKKAEEEKKEKEDTFTRLQDLAIQRSLYHPNASGGGHGFRCDATPVHITAAEDSGQTPDVADDEWD